MSSTSEALRVRKRGPFPTMDLNPSARFNKDRPLATRVRIPVRAPNTYPQKRKWGGSDWEELLKEFKIFCNNLSDHKLKQLSNIIRSTRKEKFPERSLSENVNRTFSDQELIKFFAAIDNPKYRLLFMIQYTLSLRISEVCIIKVDSVDFIRSTLSIFEPKTKRLIEKKVPNEVFIQLLEYIEKNKEQIRKCDNYLWYSEGTKNKQSLAKHLSPDYLRKVFREIRVKAGLNKVYALSHQGLPLYTLATHSLRRTGITKMATALGGDLTQLKLYSGHKSVRSLETYIQHKKEKVDRLVDQVFSAEERTNQLKRFFQNK